MRPRIALAYLLFLLSCSPPSSIKDHQLDKSEKGTENPAAEPVSREIVCDYPFRAELGRPFVVVVSSRSPDSSEGPILVTMSSGKEDIKYDPSAFKLRPGQRQLVNATVRSSRSGLAEIIAFPNDTRGYCDETLDVGFQGHLKVITLPLPYNEPQSLNVQIVDNNEKPLPADVSLSMELQSADALLSQPMSPASKGQISDAPIRLEVPLGSTSSLPFLVRSLNRKGTPVHLLATLKKGSAVLAQNVFTLDTEPAWWLPILLAIGGAALYGAYSIIKASELPSGKAAPMSGRLLGTLSISIFAGTIAYLFADFDLLGLKLDPHVLRTYPLLGFLFSFIGVDVILSSRFRRNNSESNNPGATANTVERGDASADA